MSNLFNNEYRGKKVLITGATGFIGSWLSIWLEKLGAEVIGYSLESPTIPSMFQICTIDNKIYSIIGDIRDDNKIQKVFCEYKPDIVFHLAAQPLVRASYLFPRETFETNVMGTVNILEAARKCDSVKAVIVITSDKCYENREWVYAYRENDPMGGFDPYSSSKGCAELVVSAYRNSFYNERGIALSSVRAGNVIGGGDWAEDRLIPDFVRAVSQNNSVLVRNPLAIRPWQHVLEPLSGYLWLGALMAKDRDKYSDAWNFGPLDSESLNVEDMLKLAITSWGEGSVEIQTKSQPHEANLLKLEISKARLGLKWVPLYGVNTAVEKTIQWYKSYYADNTKNMYEYTLSQIEEYEKDAKEKKLEWCLGE